MKLITAIEIQLSFIVISYNSNWVFLLINLNNNEKILLSLQVKVIKDVGKY